MTITDANNATKYSSPNAINTEPHTPNAANAPDSAAATAENKPSVRKLLDGQEYNVAKGGIIKKGFGRKYAVEQCMAYLHGLSQITVCPRYTGDLITSCT